jgi:hypothetical protein
LKIVGLVYQIESFGGQIAIALSAPVVKAATVCACL